ncbi:MAG: hypothetical protein HY423_16140 [Candidatus Lambdaproteobacteria bacterium]|nr:hypothetical protein [Candidatus Lambdaproteobacteria bacterium]
MKPSATFGRRMRIVAWCAGLMLVGFAAQAGDKENYAAKVKENDATIGVIAGVINYVCPKIAPKGSAMCTTDDAVGKAVALATHIEEGKPVQNQRAADQFADAVEQFKQHIPLRQKAAQYAKNGDFRNAFGYEEFAFQYLVKTATQGINAKKMVDGE